MQSEETKALIRQLSQELEAGNLTTLDAHPGLAEIRPRIVQELAAGHSIRISEIVVESGWVMACAVSGDNVSEVLGMYRIVDRKIVSHHAQGETGVTHSPSQTSESTVPDRFNPLG